MSWSAVDDEEQRLLPRPDFWFVAGPGLIAALSLSLLARPKRKLRSRALQRSG
jgi:hypothetical protein